MLKAEATSVGRYRSRPARQCGIVLLEKSYPVVKTKRFLKVRQKRGTRYYYLRAISHERTRKARDVQRGVTDPFEGCEFVKNDESIVCVVYPFDTDPYEVKEG